MENGISNISGLVEQFPYIGLFLLLILGGAGLPFPEDATLILCGFLISTEVIKPVPALLVIYSGMLMTDFGLYFVGRKYGRKVVTHRLFRKILSPQRLSLYEDRFRKKGIFFILIGRHLVGLRAQIFITAGVMRMSARKFLAADAFSSLFTVIIMVGSGYMGGHSYRIINRDFTRIEHIGVVLAVLLFALYLLFKYVKSRRNEMKF